MRDLLFLLLFLRCAPVSSLGDAQRALGANLAAPASGGVFVRLPGPVDIPTSLELFRRSGDDLIDRWDGTHLVRTLRPPMRSVAYVCTVAGSIAEPALHVMVDDPGHLPEIERAVRAAFVPAPPEFAALLQRDPVIARLNAVYPGLRTVRQFDLLAALVRCISAQQVSLRWAVTTRRRLAEAFAGPDYTVPVFEPEARVLLSKVEPIVRHYDVKLAP